MSAQLYLQEERNRLDEFGLGLHYSFGVDTVETLRDLLASGELTLESVYHDPVAGHLMGVPDETLSAMSPSAWTQTGSTWRTASVESKSADGTQAAWPAALQFTGSGEWALATAADREWGEPFWLRLITYTGTQSPITLTFGGVWRVRLFDTGQADLAEQTPVVDPDTGEQTGTEWTLRRQWEWMLTQQFAPSLHWLWCYEVRGKLVFRHWGVGPDNKLAGMVYDDPGAQAEPERDLPESAEGEAQPPVKHALREGEWAAEGTGPITLAWCRQKFVPSTSRLAHPQLIELVSPSTQPAEVTLHTVGDVVPSGTEDDPDTQLAPTVSVTNRDGDPWPQAGTHSAYDALSWAVEWETTDQETCYLSALALRLARTVTPDGNVGTDVIALSGVADKAITVTRDERTRESLRAELSAARRNLAAWCQGNMAVRYVVDGVTRFRGLTSGARWTGIIDTAPEQTGWLLLEAEGLWRRFRKQVWPGGPAFDGRKLTDCLKEVLAAALLTEDEYAVTDDPFTFPEPPEGEPPGLVWRPGTSLDRILEDLQRKWYGATWTHYFRMSDGKFVFERIGAVSLAASFYGTVAAAEAAGVPGQVMLDESWDQALDDVDQYTLVAVIGQTPDGQPLLARAIDWGAMQDPGAANYNGGELWPLIVADPGLQTQAAVNLACRGLYHVHRLPRVRVQWRSVRVDVHPDQYVALVGAQYGQTVRLTGVQLEQAATGDAAATAGRATYSGEVVA